MSKLFLIIRREYLTRVRRPSFILTTLLAPFAMAIFVVAINLIFGYDTTEEQQIAVVDESDLFNGTLPDGNGLYFTFLDLPVEAARDTVEASDRYSGLLVIPEVTNARRQDFRVRFISDETLGVRTELTLQRRIERRLRDYKIEALSLDRATVSALDTDVDIRSQRLTGDDDTDTSMSSEVGGLLGMAMGFLMYLFVILYGMMVMKAVMEEKTNRIVEVVVSTVKPFTLLLGKIIGVGLLALTQLLTWGILVPILTTVASIIFGFDPAAQQEAMPPGAEISPDEAQTMIEGFINGLAALNWGLIIPGFLLFFIGGYLLYAALFAAVGAAMGDDMGESGTMTLPIMVPIIISFWITLKVAESPSSGLSVWSSIFPFFSPIVMPARMAFDPPVWQVGLSLVLLIATALGLVWVAGRIYRVGILNYGKKGGFADMGRWLFAKS